MSLVFSYFSSHSSRLFCTILFVCFISTHYLANPLRSEPNSIRLDIVSAESIQSKSLAKDTISYPIYLESLKLYTQGKFKASLLKIRSIFDSTQDTTPLRILAAANYIALKRYRSAQAHLKQILTTEAQNIQALYLEVRMLRVQRKYSLAEQKAKEALLLYPKSRRLLLELSAVYYQSNNFKLARSYLIDLLQINSNDFYALYLDAVLLLKEGNYEFAKFRLQNALRVALKESLDLVLVYNNLGVAFYEIASRARSLGNAKLAKESYAEALKYYRHALELHPSHATVLTNKSKIRL